MKRGAVSSLLVLAMLAGCGGGGGGSTILSGGGGPAPTLAPAGSAKFTVDARTGEVKVEPLSDSRAVFAGSALSFTSTQLLSEGSPERRLIRVSAKNNTQEEIGASGRIRLVFSDFRNENTASTDLRSLTRTETVLGNGTAGTTFGAASTATINAPMGLTAGENPKTLFIASDSIVRLESETAARLAPHALPAVAIARSESLLLSASTTSIQVPVVGGSFSILAGLNGTSAFADGDFTTARFVQINDIHIVSGTSTDDFEAIVADGTRLRRVRKNSTIPNGEVSTLYSAADTIHGYTVKGGYEYLSLGFRVFVKKDSNVTPITSATPGFLDGLGGTARFTGPRHLRWIGDSLFVADSTNNRVRKLNLRPGGLPTDAPSWWVSTISGSSTASGVDGTGIMTHNGPHGLTQGVGEELYVSDRLGNRVRRITPTTGRFAGYTGNGLPNPTTLAALANADGVIPTDSERVPYIDRQTVINPGETEGLGDWQFILPEGLTAFSFIVTAEADTAVPAVLPAVSNTGTGTKGSSLVSVRTFAGNVEPGYADGSLSIAAFSSIRDLDTTDDGTIFVTDSISLRRISTDGRVTTILGGPARQGTNDGYGDSAGISSPTGISCSPDGRTILFCQLNHVVRMMQLEPGSDPNQASNWRVTTIVGENGALGTTVDVSGDLARLNAPSDVVYAGPSQFYIVDGGNNRILSASIRNSGFIAPQDTFIRLLAGSTISGFGDGTGSSAAFFLPNRAVLGQNGFIYLADQGNRRVRVIDSSGRTTTLAGGPSGFLDSANPAAVQFNNLVGVAVDKSGYVYCSANGSAQIRRLAPNGVSATVAGTANLVGTADGSGATALFDFVNALAISKGGDLYAGDRHRIRKIQRIISN